MSGKPTRNEALFASQAPQKQADTHPYCIDAHTHISALAVIALDGNGKNKNDDDDGNGDDNGDDVAMMTMIMNIIVIVVGIVAVIINHHHGQIRLLTTTTTNIVRSPKSHLM